MSHSVLFVAVSSSVGGGNRSLLSILERLDRALIAPVVVCPSHGRLTELLDAINVEWHVVRRATAFSKFKPFGLLREVAQYASIIRRRRIDLVHANDLTAWMGASIAARLCRTLATCHVRCDTSHEYLSYLSKWCPRPALLIANSEAMRSHMDGKFTDVGWRGRCTALPNAVDTERFTPPSGRSFDNHDRPMNILFASNLAPCKGPDVFLRIAARIRSAGVAAAFQIAGEDLDSARQYESELRELSRQLQLQDCVSFLGFRDDMPEVYRSADVLVWPARKFLHAGRTGQSIGYPRTIIEAMASGVSVVASDLDGVSEAISDEETGMLIPDGDEAAFAEAVVRLARDEALRNALAKTGRHRVVHEFSLERHVREFERTLSSLLVAT